MISETTFTILSQNVVTNLGDSVKLNTKNGQYNRVNYIYYGDLWWC